MSWAKLGDCVAVAVILGNIGIVVELEWIECVSIPKIVKLRMWFVAAVLAPKSGGV